MSAASPKLKLVYFASAGRAEVIRLALHVNGISFEDCRLARAQFEALKPTLPFGRLPVLEVDGVSYGESTQILRYVGRLGGLYPPNAPLANLKIDEILHAMDVFSELLVHMLCEKDPEKKKALQNNLATSDVPRFAGLFEGRLATMQSFPVFQAKDKLFLHELAIHMWSGCLHIPGMELATTSFLDGYPLLAQTVAKVASNDKVLEWNSMQHDVPQLKLRYFDFPGRGDAIRMVLKLGGIPFEDERVSREEFEATKQSLPFQQLPVLEVDGAEPIVQSMGILRYAATLAGLYPSNDPLEALRIDEVFSLIDEAYNAPIWEAVFSEKDPANQLELYKPLVRDTFPKMAKLLDKRIGDWGGPYCTGRSLTAADVAVYCVLVYLKGGRLPGVPSTLLQPFTNLARVYDLVNALPVIVEWNKAYPQFAA